MDKRSQINALNNILNVLDLLDIKGSSSNLHLRIKSSLTEVVSALAQEHREHQDRLQQEEQTLNRTESTTG